MFYQFIIYILVVVVRTGCMYKELGFMIRRFSSLLKLTFLPVGGSNDIQTLTVGNNPESSKEEQHP